MLQSTQERNNQQHIAELIVLADNQNPAGVYGERRLSPVFYERIKDRCAELLEMLLKVC